MLPIRSSSQKYKLLCFVPLVKSGAVLKLYKERLECSRAVEFWWLQMVAYKATWLLTASLAKRPLNRKDI